MKKNYLLIPLLLSLLIAIFYSNFNQKKVIDKQIIDAIHLPKTNAFFEKADAFKYAQDYPNARIAFENLLPKATSAEDSLYTYNQLIYSLLSMNEDSLAAKSMEQLELHFPTIEKRDPSVLGDYFYNKGVFNYRIFHPKEAEMYLKLALNIYEKLYGEMHLKTANCLTELGLLHYEYAQTLDSLFKYIPLAYPIYQKSNQLIDFSAECELGMAYVSYMKWENDKAIDHCDNALKIIKTQPFFNAVLYARCLSQRGFSTKKKAEGEVDSLQKKKFYAIADSFLIQSINIGKAQKTIRQQEFLSIMLMHKARLKDSINFNKYLNELELNLETLPDKYGNLDRIKGFYADKMNQKEKSIDFYRRFWFKYKQDSTKHSMLLSEASQNLFKNYNALGNYDSASYFIKQNILIQTPFWGKDLKWAEMYAPEVYGSYKYLLISYGVAAQMFVKKYKSDNDISALKQAFEIFKLTDNHLFQGISSSNDETVLSYQKEYGEQAYSLAVEVSYLLYKRTKDDTYIDWGFRFSERMKSFILFKNSTTENMEESPRQILIDSIKFVNATISQMKWALAQNNNAFDRSELLLFQDKQNHLYKRLEREYPIYFKSKTVQIISSINEVKNLLKSDEMVVQYSLNKDATYRILINHKGYDFQLIDSTLALNQRIKTMRFLLTDTVQNHSDIQAYTHTATYLFEHLLGKIPPQYKGSNKLLIITDKTLNLIPFEALINSSDLKINKDSKFKDLPYAINYFQFSYTPAWKVFQNNSKITYSDTPTIAAFTYDFDTKELPCSNKEIGAIENIFGKKVTTFKGKDCTKFKFLSTQNQFDIIHLALHAASNPTDKEDNKIYFAPKKKDELFGFDLLKYRIKAQLVILSACQTAEGKIETGEGTFSLSRSFQQSGVKNIVASLWKIDDNATAQLMPLFYKNLFLKQTPTQALHNAKIDYIKNTIPLMTHPKYWSALILLD
jgi:CHAT domain-containing protein